MRRFVHVMTLVLAILAGSLGGPGLEAVVPDACVCCERAAAAGAGPDGCRSPSLADPCAGEAAATLSLATPLRAIGLPARAGRREPSPLPPALHQPFPDAPRPAGTRLAGWPGPSRPDPSRPFPAGHDPAALLAVFRI